MDPQDLDRPHCRYMIALTSFGIDPPFPSQPKPSHSRYCVGRVRSAESKRVFLIASTALPGRTQTAFLVESQVSCLSVRKLTLPWEFEPANAVVNYRRRLEVRPSRGIPACASHRFVACLVGVGRGHVRMRAFPLPEISTLPSDIVLCVSIGGISLMRSADIRRIE